MKITYVKNKDIDRDRYDHCLKKSFNANVFAYSWYLDTVCEDWDLLIEGKYETLCPLPIKKWMGLTLVKQPPLVPYLGVYSTKHLTPEKVSLFLKAIPYNNIKLTLNHFNQLNTSFRKTTKKIAALDLITSYEKILDRYTPKGKKLLSQNDGTFVMRSIRSDEYISFLRQIQGRKITYYTQLSRIMNFALRYKSAGNYSVYSPRNELIGAIFLIKTNNRLYVIDCIENEEGKKRFAIFRAVNHILQTNCESNLTLEIPFNCASLTPLISFDFHQCLNFKKSVLW